MSRPSRAFLVACAAVGLALVGLYVVLASQEWFFGEDFVFLRQAQVARDWWSVFFPFERRQWWSYRPLTIEVYYTGLQAIFGVNAFPFLLVSIAAQVGAGLIVFRIAKQLRFDVRAAIVSALLSIAMYPSLNGELFWTSSFQTFGSKFFYVLTITVFIDFLERGGRWRQAASVVGMLLTLLSGEVGMTLPGPLALLALFFREGSIGRRVGAAVRAVAPHVVLLGLYLPFRYVWMGPALLPMPGLYQPHLGFHILRHIPDLLVFLSGVSPLRAGVLVGIVVLGWIAAGRAGAGELRRLANRSWVLCGWLLATMVPFLGMFFVHHRAAIISEAPFCLLLGAHLDAIVRAVPTAASRWLEAALVALVVLAIPYGAIALQAEVPRGAVGREIVEIVAQHRAEIPDEACVDLVPRPEDSWPDADLFALGFRAGGSLGAVEPKLRLRLPPPSDKRRRRMRCRDEFQIELRPGPPAANPTFRLQAKGLR